MATPAKPYEAPLDPELAKDILAIPLRGEEDPPPARTIGERVRRATQAVEEANRHLAASPMARIIADTLMRQQKKRGYPSLRVRPDGVVILHVSYEPPPASRGGVGKPEHTVEPPSNLPKLAFLRDEAEIYGVDISDLGRARRAIFERLEKHKRKRMVQDELAAIKPPKSRLVDEVSESQPKLGLNTKRKGARRNEGT